MRLPLQRGAQLGPTADIPFLVTLDDYDSGTVTLRLTPLPHDPHLMTPISLPPATPPTVTLQYDDFRYRIGHVATIDGQDYLFQGGGRMLVDDTDVQVTRHTFLDEGRAVDRSTDDTVVVEEEELSMEGLRIASDTEVVRRPRAGRPRAGSTPDAQVLRQVRVFFFFRVAPLSFTAREHFCVRWDDVESDNTTTALAPGTPALTCPLDEVAYDDRLSFLFDSADSEGVELLVYDTFADYVVDRLFIGYHDAQEETATIVTIAGRTFVLQGDGTDGAHLPVTTERGRLHFRATELHFPEEDRDQACAC